MAAECCCMAHILQLLRSCRIQTQRSSLMMLQPSACPVYPLMKPRKSHLPASHWTGAKIAAAKSGYLHREFSHNTLYLYVQEMMGLWNVPLYTCIHWLACTPAFTYLFICTHVYLHIHTQFFIHICTCIYIGKHRNTYEYNWWWRNFVAQSCDLFRVRPSYMTCLG